MKKSITPFVLLLGLAASSFAGPSTPSAETVVNDAIKQAQKGNRGVLVMFHASWCGWCHRLDKTLEKPEVAKMLEKRFVIIHIDGSERPEKISLENAGWEKYSEKWGAKDQGLPFLVTLDAKGEKKGDSKIPDPKTGTPANFGFPTEPAEYARLSEILKAANPEFSSKEVTVLLDALKADRPKS